MSMVFLELIRIIHIVSATLWVGGISYITLVTIQQALHKKDPVEKVLSFMAHGHRFRPLSIVYIVSIGITGIILLLYYGIDVWFYTETLKIKIIIKIIIYLTMSIIMLFMPQIQKILSYPDKDSLEGILIRTYRIHWLLTTLGILAIIDSIFILK